MGTYTDDFLRADESPLASPWATPTGASSLDLVSNEVVPDDATDRVMYYNNTTADAQYSEAACTAATGYSVGNGPGVGCRIASGANTYYRLIVNQQGSNNIELGKKVAGTFTTIADYTATYSDGAVLRVEANGTTITVKYNGSSLGTPTDASISTGFAGLAYSSEGAGKFSHMDTWAGGDLVISREQEGYRWRNDDGSESAATWKAAQDTALTLGASSAARLRTLVDVTNDPPSEALTFQFKRSTDSLWKDVRRALP